jgi:CBS domain-containing protein
MSDPFSRSVTEIMSPEVATIRSDANIADAAATLARNGVSGMPVVDEHGVVVGVVSLTDFVAALSASGAPDDACAFYDSVRLVRLMDHLLRETGRGLEKVGDIMSTRLVSVAPDASIRDAARVMASKHVHRVLVIDASGKLAGIISAIDVVALV